MTRALAVVLLLAAVACGGGNPEVSEDLDQQVTELEQDVADLGEQLDQAEARRQAEDAAEFQRCYHDPDTETTTFGLPDCDTP